MSESRTTVLFRIHPLLFLVLASLLLTGCQVAMPWNQSQVEDLESRADRLTQAEIPQLKVSRFLMPVAQVPFTSRTTLAGVLASSLPTRDVNLARQQLVKAIANTNDLFQEDDLDQDEWVQIQRGRLTVHVPLMALQIDELAHLPIGAASNLFTLPHKVSPFYKPAAGSEELPGAFTRVLNGTSESVARQSNTSLQTQFEWLENEIKAWRKRLADEGVERRVIDRVPFPDTLVVTRTIKNRENVFVIPTAQRIRNDGLGDFAEAHFVLSDSAQIAAGDIVLAVNLELFLATWIK